MALGAGFAPAPVVSGEEHRQGLDFLPDLRQDSPEGLLGGGIFHMGVGEPGQPEERHVPPQGPGGGGFLRLDLIFLGHLEEALPGLPQFLCGGGGRPQKPKEHANCRQGESYLHFVSSSFASP